MAVGILERNKVLSINVTGNTGSQLDILVENMGRINYGKDINDFKVALFSDSANDNFLISFLFSVKCWFDFFGAASQGLVTNLTLGEYVLTDWTMYSLSIDEAINQGIIDEDGAAPEDPPQPAALSLPTFYRGSFIIPDGIPDLPQDTYIKLPSWRKACDLFLLFILHVL